jgi:hypothetical protein
MIFIIQCGTLTITELLELDPAESVTVNVIVYILPEPLPERSARNRTWFASITSQSGEVLPSPVPSTGSLLLIVMTGLRIASQLSLTLYLSVTGTIW